MNRLADETSPYLLQHAENPVDWYPWGEEALARARDEDRPILLSVGYCACHWCHVMAHESFEDAETAALMNEHFVNVKVDREERPDVDALYMEAVQRDDGPGRLADDGLPDPDGRAVLRRHVLPARAAARDAGVPSAARGGGGLAGRSARTSSAGRGVSTAVAAARATDRAGGGSRSRRRSSRRPSAGSRGVRPVDGGFGGAPKFPHAIDARVPAAAHARPATRRCEMVRTTLDGDGGAAASTTSSAAASTATRSTRWLVPHFEKMLYDNALLAATYLHASVVTGDQRYRVIVEETLDHMVRELRLPDGGLASAQDADTNGVEGLTFTWTEEEGVPADLLQPFEHGRSIIRGSLDPALRARLLAERELRPGRGSTTRCSPRGTASLWRRSPRELGGWSGPTGSRRRSAWGTSCWDRCPAPTGASHARGGRGR